MLVLIPAQDLGELREHGSGGVGGDRHSWLGLELQGGSEPMPPTKYEEVVEQIVLHAAVPLVKSRHRQKPVLARGTLRIQPGPPVEEHLHLGTPNPPCSWRQGPVRGRVHMNSQAEFQAHLNGAQEPFHRHPAEVATRVDLQRDLDASWVPMRVGLVRPLLECSASRGVVAEEPAGDQPNAAQLRGVGVDGLGQVAHVAHSGAMLQPHCCCRILKKGRLQGLRGREEVMPPEEGTEV